MTRDEVLEILATRGDGCSRCYDPDEPDHECCMVPAIKEAMALVESAGWRLTAPAPGAREAMEEQLHAFACFMMEREFPNWANVIDGHPTNRPFIEDRVAHYRKEFEQWRLSLPAGKTRGTE